MIKFIKTRDVKNPVRNPLENAGIDFYVPENTEDFRQALVAKNAGLVEAESITFGTADAIANNKNILTKNGEIHIAPHCAIIIPTGIKSKFEPNLALIANNKSGIATKKQLIFGASVIDASYQGEWHINLINTSNNYQVIECGQKAVQFIPHYISIEPIEVEDKNEEEFFTEKTSRGEGWQGSTGLK